MQLQQQVMECTQGFARQESVFQFVLSAYFSLPVVCVNQQLSAPCSHYHLLGAAYSGENNCWTLKATLRIFSTLKR